MTTHSISQSLPLRKPVWIRTGLAGDGLFGRTEHAVHGRLLHTVCEEAKCPNRSECWSRGTATFMLMGDVCTRACGFCAVKNGRPTFNEPDEPNRIADAVAAMNLKYVVLTSVTRDDLPDGGASVFAHSLLELRRRWPGIGVEFLTPDFRNCQERAIRAVDDALSGLPEGTIRALVWGHNVETVPRLYRQVRKGSSYERSLALLEAVARLDSVESKSSLMLGLGETREEIVAVLADLRRRGVSRVSLGQYLQPSRRHLPVLRYLHPEEFADYEQLARQLGFRWVKAGPLVRSSYYAES